MISTILIVALLQFASSTQIHSITEYIGKFPYHVSIRDSNGLHICSGAIVKSNAILANGNCDFSASYIVAGSELTTLNQQFTQTIKISKIERNIGAFGERYMNLYFLEKDLQFNDSVQPISISTQDPFEGSHARITGFVDINGDKRLRSTDVTISNYDECKSLLNHPRYGPVISCQTSSSKTELCRALEQTSLLACFGEKIQLCGIYYTSFGFYCELDTIKKDQEKFMTGFIRFSNFKDWLTGHNVL